MKKLYSLAVLLAFFVAFSCGKPEAVTPTEDNNNKEEQTTPDTPVPTPEPEPEPEPQPDPQPVQSPEGCVENDIVYAYMQCGTYEKFGAKTWFKDPVVKATSDLYNGKYDRPKGISVSWEAKADVTVSLSTGGTVVWEDSATEADSYSFMGVIPGVTYNYTVSAGGAVVKEGSFTPTGLVRMVDIPGTWNYRDIGGWTGLGGKPVRYGWLYRGASLNGKFIGTEKTEDVYDYTKYEWTPAMQKATDFLGIKAELDLRGDLNDIGLWGNEYDSHSGTLRHAQIEGADFIHIMSDFGIHHPKERSSIVQDVAWIIYELQQGKPVAFHCKSGADRTGAVALLLEGLLGVTEGDAARDYELTTLSTEKTTKYTKYASEAISYLFFTRKGGIFSMEGETFQEKCYFYLNQFFEDVHINADDLDWFIGFMLDYDGFQRPANAKNYENNPLETVFSIDTGSGLHTY